MNRNEYNRTSNVVKLPRTKFMQYNRVRKKNVIYWRICFHSDLYRSYASSFGCVFDYNKMKTEFDKYKHPGYGVSRYRNMQNALMHLAAGFSILVENKTLRDASGTPIALFANMVGRPVGKDVIAVLKDISFFCPWFTVPKLTVQHCVIKTLAELEQIFELTPSASTKGFVSVDMRVN